MAIIPLKQLVTITRISADDDWGEVKTSEVFTLKARVDEKVTLVKNQRGEVITSRATVYFGKLADVRYDDILEYTNELGIITREKPIAIRPLRNMASKPLLTEVSL